MGIPKKIKPLLKGVCVKKCEISWDGQRCFIWTKNPMCHNADIFFIYVNKRWTKCTKQESDKHLKISQVARKK